MAFHDKLLVVFISKVVQLPLKLFVFQNVWFEINSLHCNITAVGR